MSPHLTHLANHLNIPLGPACSRPDLQRLAIKGILRWGQTYQVGAHFEALNELVLKAASDLRCLFFPANLSHLNDVLWAAGSVSLKKSSIYLGHLKLLMTRLTAFILLVDLYSRRSLSRLHLFHWYKLLL